MKIDGDTLTFSSGNHLYANRGIVGISPELAISHGYDGALPDANDGDREVTAADLRELADYMIGLWQSFKARQTATASPEESPEAGGLVGLKPLIEI